MANKPVAGTLLYNPLTDRPRVKLRVGERDLLTTDDSGGGGAVSSVSGTGAIDVTPTTGATVVSLDESALENGGAQEISVAGLSGQLADGQRASALVTTGADVVVSGAAPPTVNQVLKATSATAASWQADSGADVIGNFWAKPTTAHAKDVEFDSSTLPAAWKLWRLSDNTDQTANIVTTPQFPGPAAGLTTGKCVIVANHTRARSHLIMQPFMATGEPNWFYGFSATLGADHVFRARVRGQYVPYSLFNNNINVKLMVLDDNGSGVPDLANRVSIGWEIDNNDAYVGFFNSLAGVGTTSARSVNAAAVTDSATNRYIFVPDMEFILVKHNTDWYGFLGGNGPLLSLGWINPYNGFTHSTQWIGFQFAATTSTSAGQSPPYNLWATADYYRQQDDLEFFM